MEARYQRARGDRRVIPSANILEWSEHAPWPTPRQIEQDLIICRALCNIFSDSFLAERLAFRGGTAINKLLFPSPLRYSEDIDLVQTQNEPMGPTISALRKALAWLGRCRVDSSQHSTHLLFKFAPEDTPEAPLNLKVEINIAEHENLFGIHKYPFAVANTWFSGKVEIASFEANELFGTKLRALLQRRKNRDLFDLGEGLARLNLDPDKVVASFNHYLRLQGKSVSRAEAEERMLEKINHDLVEDIAPLLPVGVEFNEDAAMTAFQSVWNGFVARMAGEPWRSGPQAIEEIRKTIPLFLR